MEACLLFMLGYPLHVIIHITYSRKERQIFLRFSYLISFVLHHLNVLLKLFPRKSSFISDLYLQYRKRRINYYRRLGYLILLQRNSLRSWLPVIFSSLYKHPAFQHFYPVGVARLFYSRPLLRS